MSSSIIRLWKRPGSRGAVVLLLALVSLALCVEGSQPFHSHSDEELGLYNAECLLATLAAVHAEGPVAMVHASGWVAILALGVTFAPSGSIAAPPVRSAQPRAPPLA